MRIPCTKAALHIQEDLLYILWNEKTKELAQKNPLAIAELKFSIRTNQLNRISFFAELFSSVFRIRHAKITFNNSGSTRIVVATFDCIWKEADAGSRRGVRGRKKEYTESQQKANSEVQLNINSSLSTEQTSS